MQELSVIKAAQPEGVKYPKLRGRIVEKYGSQEAFAREVGLSTTSMSKKMTGKVGISQSDILKWCPLLDIEVNDIGAYFYA